MQRRPGYPLLLAAVSLIGISIFPFDGADTDTHVKHAGIR
jgi:hypothetical protein